MSVESYGMRVPEDAIPPCRKGGDKGGATEVMKMEKAGRVVRLCRLLEENLPT